MFLSDIFIQGADESSAHHTVWDNHDSHVTPEVDMRRRRRAMRRAIVRRQMHRWGGVITFMRRIAGLFVMGLLIAPLAVTGGVTVLMMRFAEWYSHRQSRAED